LCISGSSILNISYQYIFSGDTASWLSGITKQIAELNDLKQLNKTMSAATC